MSRVGTSKVKLKAGGFRGKGDLLGIKGGLTLS